MSYAIVNLLLTVIDIYWWIVIASFVISWLIAFDVINTRSQAVYSSARARRLDRAGLRADPPRAAELRRAGFLADGVILASSSSATLSRHSFAVAEPAASAWLERPAGWRSGCG